MSEQSIHPKNGHQSADGDSINGPYLIKAVGIWLIFLGVVIRILAESFSVDESGARFVLLFISIVAAAFWLQLDLIASRWARLIVDRNSGNRPVLRQLRLNHRWVGWFGVFSGLALIFLGAILIEESWVHAGDLVIGILVTHFYGADLMLNDPLRIFPESQAEQVG